MRIRPLLLHALLSLALVANGIGAAMASVHTVCAHDAVAAAAPVAEPPCHEGMGADASNMHNGMHHDNVLQSSVSQQPSDSDKESCGDCADHCQCACDAHGLAALMPSTVLLSPATGIAYTPAPSYAHAAPELPHPVRPPIG
jgi:hypothetical protein